jgi:hypothetical protein
VCVCVCVCVCVSVCVCVCACVWEQLPVCLCRVLRRSRVVRNLVTLNSALSNSFLQTCRHSPPGGRRLSWLAYPLRCLTKAASLLTLALTAVLANKQDVPNAMSRGTLAQLRRVCACDHSTATLSSYRRDPARYGAECLSQGNDLVRCCCKFGSVRVFRAQQCTVCRSVMETCGTTGAGVREALDWLESAIAQTVC